VVKCFNRSYDIGRDVVYDKCMQVESLEDQLCLMYARYPLCAVSTDKSNQLGSELANKSSSGDMSREVSTSDMNDPHKVCVLVLFTRALAVKTEGSQLM